VRTGQKGKSCLDISILLAFNILIMPI